MIAAVEADQITAEFPTNNLTGLKHAKLLGCMCDDGGEMQTSGSLIDGTLTADSLQCTPVARMRNYTSAALKSVFISVPRRPPNENRHAQPTKAGNNGQE